MKLKYVYSHLNGLEWLKVHHPELWFEIQKAVEAVDASLCRTKISKEKTKKGKVLYSPKEMNRRIGDEFKSLGWKEERFVYYVTSDERLSREIVGLSPKEQKAKIEESGHLPILSKHQTDFVKNRVAVEVQFGKYPFIEFDLFVKHLGFYVVDSIDLGIEVIPTKQLEAEMSSGVGYFERVIAHLSRQGRGNPSVPLIILGIEP